MPRAAIQRHSVRSDLSHVTSGIGSATYKGLLVRAEKRLSQGWQFLASYAYSSNVGDNFDPGFNNDNPLDNRGPLDRDVRHILSLSGLAQLPKRFQMGLFVSYISKPPFSAVPRRHWT